MSSLSVTKSLLQGQVKGQLDKLEGEPNHWTFLTGQVVGTLPMS